jgi:hypothetical protein
MSELKDWATAFAVMLVGSIAVAFTRLLRSPFFVVEFEVCIFYLPTVVLGLVCLRGYARRCSFPILTRLRYFKAALRQRKASSFEVTGRSLITY